MAAQYAMAYHCVEQVKTSVVFERLLWGEILYPVEFCGFMYSFMSCSCTQIVYRDLSYTTIEL